MKLAASALAAISMSLLGCTSPPKVAATTPDISQCPDLAGSYAEAGVKRAPGRPDEVAHLSWLILGSHITGTEMKYEPEKARLYVAPKPGVPMIYFAQNIRISHPKRDRIELKAFDKGGKSLGAFEIGSEQGFFCRNGAFVAESAGRYGGVDFTPVHDIRSSYHVFRADDGSLVIARHITTQEVSKMLLGSPIGDPIVQVTEETYYGAK
jgi:hypothetical protein